MLVLVAVEIAHFQESFGILCLLTVLTSINFPLRVIFQHEKRWRLVMRDMFLAYSYSLNNRVCVTAAMEVSQA